MRQREKGALSSHCIDGLIYCHIDPVIVLLITTQASMCRSGDVSVMCSVVTMLFLPININYNYMQSFSVCLSVCLSLSMCRHLDLCLSGKVPVLDSAVIMLIM